MDLAELVPAEPLNDDDGPACFTTLCIFTVANADDTGGSSIQLHAYFSDQQQSEWLAGKARSKIS